jgi:ATP-dependent Clp protease ATP-binding subunit ClpA
MKCERLSGAAMYERFTDRARRVMEFANQEAWRFNHEYLGTEHILLGLVREGTGVAANILKNVGADLRNVRLEVEKIVQSGPDIVTMGKVPMTPRAKKVIEIATNEARNLNHAYVGTEHLFLGLVNEDTTVAAQVLLNLGIQLKGVREEVVKLLVCSPTEPEVDLAEEIVKGFEQQIDLINRFVSSAIADMDFEKGALLRDITDKLKELKTRFIKF